jgi:hypothetical protein
MIDHNGSCEEMSHAQVRQIDEKMRVRDSTDEKGKFPPLSKTSHIAKTSRNTISKIDAVSIAERNFPRLLADVGCRKLTS